MIERQFKVLIGEPTKKQFSDRKFKHIVRLNLLKLLLIKVAYPGELNIGDKGGSLDSRKMSPKFLIYKYKGSGSILHLPVLSSFHPVEDIRVTQALYFIS